MYTKTIYITASCIGAIIAIGIVFWDTKTVQVRPAQACAGQTCTVSIGNAQIHVDIARTAAEQARGLGGRDSLAPDRGMLFVFNTDGRYPFWMRDMRFSIDIIWIAANGTVVAITPGVSPSTYPETFAPSAPVRFVLEVPAGFVDSHGLKNGDKMTFSELSTVP